MNHWTGETIATVIFVPLSLLLTSIGVYFLRQAEKKDKENYDPDPILFRVPWIGLTTLGVAIVAGTIWGMYPWKAEYHQYRPITGVVDTIDSRLVGDGSSIDQKFVVQFKDNPQQYGVLDTRAAGVKPGDLLKIACVRRWQYAGTDGFDCNFVSKEGPK